MTGYRSVYITIESPEEASRIGRIVVEERLAACVNIIKDMQSVYWWEGKVEEATEVVMIAKTSESRLSALTARVKALHSYDCPCIVALPVNAGEGNAEYLSWIDKETAAS